jgi:hypothetical protein
LVNRSGEKLTRWKVQLRFDKKLKAWGPGEPAVTEASLESAPQQPTNPERPAPPPNTPDPTAVSEPTEN